jgi:hypothetical protein
VVQHQGGHLDQGQEGAHVDLEQRPQMGPDPPWAGDGPLEPGRPAPEPLVVGVAGGVRPGVVLGAPQLLGPGDHRPGGLGRDPDRVVVGGQIPGGGVGQDERGRPLRPGPGEEQRHRAGLGAGGQQRRPPHPGRGHDRVQLLGVGLPGRQRVGRQRVRGPGPAPVEAQQPRERGQPAQEQRHLGVVPDQVDMAEAAHGEHQVGRPLAEDLVGEPVRPEPGVPGLRRHDPSATRAPCSDAQPRPSRLPEAAGGGPGATSTACGGPRSARPCSSRSGPRAPAPGPARGSSSMLRSS